jgi:hypothetical protein
MIELVKVMVFLNQLRRVFLNLRWSPLSLSNVALQVFNTTPFLHPPHLLLSKLRYALVISITFSAKY